MQLRYTLTEDAFFDYNLYCCTRSPSQAVHLRKWRVLPAVLWLVAGVSLSVILYSGRLMLAVTIMAACLVAASTWYCCYPGMYRRAIAKALKRWFAENDTTEHTGVFFLELTDTGLRETGGGTVMEVPYGRVDNIVADNGRLYVFIGADRAILVPDEAFPAPEDRERFIALLEEKSRRL